MIFWSNGQLEHCFNNEQRNAIQQIYEAERDSRECWKAERRKSVGGWKGGDEQLEDKMSRCGSERGWIIKQ